MELNVENFAWEKIFSAGPVCVFVCENKPGLWPVVRITENIQALSGWEADLFTSGRKHYDELIHEDDRERITQEAISKRVDNPKQASFDYRIVKRSGEVRHVIENTESVFNDAGEITHMVGYIVDVTTVREQQAAQLKRQQDNADERLKEATNTMVQGVVVFGNVCIQAMNTSACAMLGLTDADRLVGKPWRKQLRILFDDPFVATSKEDQQETAKVIRKAQALEPFNLERITKNGLSIRIDAVPYGENGMVINYSNISEMKQRESDLQAATKAATSAERAKSEFLANMSHEIRTPMNGVMGMAELLLSTDLDPKQKMFSDMIVKSGNALLTIINDILDFSKIDAGQLELHPEPFVLAEAVEDVATLVSAGAAEKGLELIVRVDPALPCTYLGDVGRIRQIITNLVGNAVKFTEQGHVFADVSGTVDENDVATLHFRVEDTGVGIAEDKIAHVFEKFQQVDTSTTRKHEGTGLGLSIVSSLVDLMGGEIGVESKEGVGTVFSFTIALPVERGEMRRQVTPIDAAGARVLVIDDNDVNRSILSEQLEAWRFEHAEMASGPLGLTFMRQAMHHGLTVDLVVLDYQMPDMSGIDVLREMRSDPLLSRIPAILLTSVDAAGTRSALGDLRLEATLIKPTRSSLLLETMLRVIAEARGGDSATTPPTFAALADRLKSGQGSREKPTGRRTRLSESTEPPMRRQASCQLVRPLVQAARADLGLDILVAEDNEMNQVVFTKILETTDYTFKIVENGALAVANWTLHRPRMILMDVSMPEMNGHEATKAIRDAECDVDEDSRVTIVGVTAHALGGDRESCMDIGMDDYLSKPVSPKELVRKIDKYLHRGSDQMW